MDTMRFVIMSLIVAALIPALANAQGVTITPSNISLSTNLSDNSTVKVTISTKSSIYDNIAFTSAWITSYSPTGLHIEPGMQGNFTMMIHTIDEYNRSPEELNVTNIILKTMINVTGDTANGTVLLGVIPISMNITLPKLAVPEREYIFKKCFIENEQEFCTSFNMTAMVEELKNVTVINQSVNNISYNILMPYNTTRDFMEEYAKTLQEAADQMAQERTQIADMLNQSLQMQQQENDKFKNSITLENYLKNENVPLWVEIAPDNQLMNVTGFTEQQLYDAINVLFQDNKLTQKTETKTISIPVSNGVMTQNIQETYIASSERLASDSNTQASQSTLYLSIGIVILCMLIVLFWLFVWNKRVKM